MQSWTLEAGGKLVFFSCLLQFVIFIWHFLHFFSAQKWDLCLINNWRQRWISKGQIISIKTYAFLLHIRLSEVTYKASSFVMPLSFDKAEAASSSLFFLKEFVFDYLLLKVQDRNLAKCGGDSGIKNLKLNHGLLTYFLLEYAFFWFCFLCF